MPLGMRVAIIFSGRRSIFNGLPDIVFSLLGQAYGWDEEDSKRQDDAIGECLHELFLLMTDSIMPISGFQVHPPQQVLETRVVAEGVEIGVDVDEGSQGIALIDGFGHPLKRTVLLPN